MAFGKDSFYLGFLFIMLIFAGLLNFGEDLLVSGIPLDNSSISYIENYRGYYDSSGIGSITNQTNVDELQRDDLVLDQQDTEGQAVTDFLAEINYSKNRVLKVLVYIRLIYNWPIFLLNLVGLPLNPFADMTAGITTVFYLGFLLYFFGKVKRG